MPPRPKMHTPVVLLAPDLELAIVGSDDGTATDYQCDYVESEPSSYYKTPSSSSSSDAASVSLSWQHISYWVHADRVVWKTHATVASLRQKREAKDGKRLLFDVSGRCGAGELTAVLGPSGSGKTTLLEILADRVRTGTVDGTVRINGAERSSDVVRAVASYVARDEALLGSLTVRETLATAAALALPAHAPRAARVDAVLDAMGLRASEHTLVGGLFHQGLSSGQKRRLSIAIELLSNPSVLLLDEPTSGLDSAAALGVVTCLAALCREQRKSVVMAIHQPSSACYALFTNALVLAEGKAVYCGPAHRALEYFASLGHPCALYSNPAEHVIALVNSDFHGHAVDVDALAERYARSAAARRTAALIADDARRANSGPELRVDLGARSSVAQFHVLLRRNALVAVRNPGLYWVRLAMYVLLSLLLGTVYLRGNALIADADRAALLFYLQAFLVFMSVAAVPVLQEQQAAFERERSNHAVRVRSFVLANAVAFTPGVFLLALASAAVVVPLTGLHSFPVFLLNLFLSLLVAESFMCVVAALATHYVAGIAVGAGVYGMFMVVEGFLVPRAALPVYWQWLHYAAFHSYSFQAFMYDHFATVDTPAAWEMLDRYGLKDVSVARNMAILAAYALALQLVFALVLARRR